MTLILLDAFFKLVNAFFNLCNELDILLSSLPAEKTAGAKNADNNDNHACNKLNDFTSRYNALVVFKCANSFFMRLKAIQVNVYVCGHFFLPIVSVI
jgi:hypothetical protein